MKQTKTFIYGVIFQCYGTQSVEVPVDFTQEQAEQYVREHWDEMPRPTGEYIPDSDEPDFENSKFAGITTTFNNHFMSPENRLMIDLKNLNDK